MTPRKPPSHSSIVIVAKAAVLAVPATASSVEAIAGMCYAVASFAFEARLPTTVLVEQVELAAKVIRSAAPIAGFIRAARRGEN